MIEIGRMCMKIAGRDAGKIGVIIDILDNNLILLDGQTRRRKCNIHHIEMLPGKLDIEKNAPTEKVIVALKAKDIEVKTTKPKPSQPKPVKKRVLEATKKPEAKPEPKK